MAGSDKAVARAGPCATGPSMPDDPADDCPPDAENNTPDAPAPRPAALQHDKPDVGCLIALGALFICIFLVPALALLGGAPLLVPVIMMFLLALATPWINPAERMSPRARWTGRVLTFLLLAGLVVAAWFLLRHYLGDRFIDESQSG
jgi:hypothetical protein